MPVGEIGYLQLWNRAGGTINPATQVVLDPAGIWAGERLAVPGTPTIYNVTLVLANTQYSQLLSVPGVHRLQFQALQPVAIRWAYASGKVAVPTSPWSTLAAGVEYVSGELDNVGAGRSSRTIYFASAVAGTIVQIIAYI